MHACLLLLLSVSLENLTQNPPKSPKLLGPAVEREKTKTHAMYEHPLPWIPKTCLSLVYSIVVFVVFLSLIVVREL
jgi:hypothetical protein